MKLRKLFRILPYLGLSGICILAFQNCQDFSLKEEVIHGQAIHDSMYIIDSKWLMTLLNTDSMTKWYKTTSPTYVDDLTLADQWSMIVAVKRTTTGKVLSLYSGASDEEGYVEIVAGKIRAGRRTGVSFNEYKEGNLPASGENMVIAASIGASRGSVQLMVNGVIQTSSVTSSGTPTDFSAIQKTVFRSANLADLKEYMVFAGFKQYEEGFLGYEELNVMSRYLANNNLISNVIFDPAILDPTNGGGGGTPGPVTNPYFAPAKAFFDAKCISCHTNGGTYPNLANLTESKALSNGWVVPKNPATSSLYYRLVGSGAMNGNMPQGGTVTPAERLVISDWINSIQ